MPAPRTLFHMEHSHTDAWCQAGQTGKTPQAVSVTHRPSYRNGKLIPDTW